MGEERRPNVVLGIPTFPHVPMDFCLSLAILDGSRCGGKAIFSDQRSNLPDSRNFIVEAAKEAFRKVGPGYDCDYLLFLDSDMTFPPHTLTRLLAHKKDIVGCAYRRRCPPYDIMGWTPDPETRRLDPLNDAGLVRVGKLPTGVMLIDMKIFEKMEKPYFNYRLAENGKLMSEDIVFCEAAVAAGIEIWCDMDLTMEVGHIGHTVFRPGVSYVQ